MQHILSSQFTVQISFWCLESNLYPYSTDQPSITAYQKKFFWKGFNIFLQKRFFAIVNHSTLIWLTYISNSKLSWWLLRGNTNKSPQIQPINPQLRHTKKKIFGRETVRSTYWGEDKRRILPWVQICCLSCQEQFWSKDTFNFSI